MVLLRNCCCCCSLRTGSYIIGILALIGSITQCVNLGSSGALNSSVRTSLIVDNVILAISCLLLLYGVYKDIHVLLLPYIIVQTISIVICAIIEIVLIVLLASGTYRDHVESKEQEDIIKAFLIAMIIGLTVGILLSLYFLLVIVSQYQTMKQGPSSTNNQGFGKV